MEPELRDLLRSVARDSNSDSHTHVSLYGPQSRWTIDKVNKQAFWTQYCDLVDRKLNGVEEQGIQAEPFAKLCLAEKARDLMPVVAKLTFKFHFDPNDQEAWEPYDENFLQWLTHTYQSVINEYFNVNVETNFELFVVILESSIHWFEDDKDSGQRYLFMELRLQFPYARVETGYQNRLIRPRVIQLLRNNNVLAKMQRQPIGDWDQIVSTNSVNEPLAMYGSSEIPERPKLNVTHIWHHITQEMLDEGQQPQEQNLFDSFVPSSHNDIQENTVSEEIFDESLPLNYWLPMFLSTDYWPRILMPREQVNDGGRFSAQLRALTSKSPSRNFGDGKKHENIDDSEAELAERMMSMLAPTRYLREAFWIDIGKALYISNEGDENGVLSWIQHTERAVGNAEPPEFMKIAGTVADTCRSLYYTFNNSTITVKTLAWYAREDNPVRWGEWHKEWCVASMEQALSGYDTDIAQALYRVYWLDYIYCPTNSRGRWFRFHNHRWIEIPQGIDLRRDISRNFMKRFESARAELSGKVRDSTDESFKNNAETTIKKITALIGKLKTNTRKSSILHEASEEFKDYYFTARLDSNTELTGLTNGLLEVTGNTTIFRSAKPEDYISMCANVPYHAHYTWEHPLVKEAMKWFGQVFTDKSLLHHFLKFAASCLKGRNSDKIFPVWTGEGNNSKSMIVKLFESAFGSYCIKFPVAMLTEKFMNSSSPSPQLARARAARVAFLDEPEDDIPMQKGTIKRYTGGDSFFARLLQDNGGDIQLTFKMILMCNKVPIIPNADRAIKDRTKLFPFMSTWVKNPPDDELEQYRQRKFRMNETFERRIPILAPAFMWIMSTYYPYYATEGLVTPPIVTETTETYWKDNDVYAQFSADSIQEVYNDHGDRDVNARATLSQIYTKFKLWFKDAFPGTKVPERTVVRAELSSRWGRMDGNAWRGIRIIEEDTPTDLAAAITGKPVKKAEEKKLELRVVPNAPGVDEALKAKIAQAAAEEAAKAKLAQIGVNQELPRLNLQPVMI